MSKARRLDFTVVKSKSMRGLVSLRNIDGTMTSIQELLTAAAFKDGDKVSLVLTEEIDPKYDEQPDPNCKDCGHPMNLHSSTRGGCMACSCRYNGER